MLAQVKTMLALAVIFVVLAFLPLSATIINVPDDYSTIQAGIDASSDGDTVLVQPDTYVENINFNGHNIVLGSLYLTTGDMIYIEQTAIDGNQSGSVVTFNNYEDSTAVICGFTLTNGSAYDGGGIYIFQASPTITANNISENSANNGAGIVADLSSAYIYNCTIEYNDAVQGSGISIAGCEMMLVNSKICNNLSSFSGSGLLCLISELYVVNSIISLNSTVADYGAAYYGFDSFTAFKNSIISDNNSDNGPNIFSNNDNGLTIEYCNIDDTLWPGDGNISTNPLFRDSENNDFHLMATYCGDPYNSPCINMGHPDSIDAYLDCQWGLGTERADMGAYGGNAEPQTDIKEYELPRPKHYALSQNYPNPFNPTTTILFTIDHPQFVTLKVYDLLGREVQTLIDENKQAGLHTVTFDASDLSSGIYFYRLQAGDMAESKRMVLLK